MSSSDRTTWPESNGLYFVIPTSLAQSLLDYLDTRPHCESRRLIDGIIACRPQPKPAPAPASDPEE